VDLARKDFYPDFNVQYDERRLAYVQVRFSGYIQKVFADATYQYVRKGQPLFNSNISGGANLVRDRFPFDLAGLHPDTLQPLWGNLDRNEQDFGRCRGCGHRAAHRILCGRIFLFGFRIRWRLCSAIVQPQSNEHDSENYVSDECQQKPCAIRFHRFAPSSRSESPVICSSRAMAVSYSAMFCQ
jgi:Barrel-sandwich domain of CusB or HlyD membrane-fusion